MWEGEGGGGGEGSHVSCGRADREQQKHAHTCRHSAKGLFKLVHPC